MHARADGRWPGGNPIRPDRAERGGSSGRAETALLSGSTTPFGAKLWGAWKYGQWPSWLSEIGDLGARGFPAPGKCDVGRTKQLVAAHSALCVTVEEYVPRPPSAPPFLLFPFSLG